MAPAVRGAGSPSSGIRNSRYYRSALCRRLGWSARFLGQGFQRRGGRMVALCPEGLDVLNSPLSSSLSPPLDAPHGQPFRKALGAIPLRNHHHYLRSDKRKRGRRNSNGGAPLHNVQRRLDHAVRRTLQAAFVYRREDNTCNEEHGKNDGIDRLPAGQDAPEGPPLLVLRHGTCRKSWFTSLPLLRSRYYIITCLPGASVWPDGRRQMDLLRHAVQFICRVTWHVC